MKRTILLTLLLIHSIVTAFVIHKAGYWSLFPPYQELHTWQIFSDLVVALSLVLFFIYLEMKKKQQKMGPLIICAIGMYFLGSISPLIFLLMNKDLFE